MDYHEFKKQLIEEVRAFYHNDAEVSTKETLKLGGRKLDGIHITLKDSNRRVMPVLYINDLYDAFKNGEKDMDGCVSVVVDSLNKEEHEKMVDIPTKITDWSFVRERVYPALISRSLNKELLRELVSTPFLDLCTIYYVRFDVDSIGQASTKITYNLLGQLGISVDELHKQAVSNMKKDGYSFQSMEDVIKGFLGKEEAEHSDTKVAKIKVVEAAKAEFKPGSLYVLSNAGRLFGAAGLLDGEYVADQLGNTSCFILPSSIHETLFVPVTESMSAEGLSDMVTSVNSEQVDVADQLSDHVYYYDGVTRKVISVERVAA